MPEYVCCALSNVKARRANLPQPSNEGNRDELHSDDIHANVTIYLTDY
jgi:hypothetical protein